MKSQLEVMPGRSGPVLDRNLTSREQKAIRMRLGIGVPAATPVNEELGTKVPAATRERIRQIEARALAHQAGAASASKGSN